MLLDQDRLHESNEIRGGHGCEQLGTSDLEVVGEGFEIVYSGTEVEIMAKLGAKNVVVS